MEAGMRSTGHGEQDRKHAHTQNGVLKYSRLSWNRPSEVERLTWDRQASAGYQVISTIMWKTRSAPTKLATKQHSSHEQAWPWARNSSSQAATASWSWVRISTRAICIGRESGFCSLWRGNDRTGRRRRRAEVAVVRLFVFGMMVSVAMPLMAPNPGRQDRGSNARSGAMRFSVVGEFAAEALPIVVVFAAELGNPAG